MKNFYFVRPGSKTVGRKTLGFSLIELLIVVLIIGIISSIAVLYIDTAHERLKSQVQLLSQMIEATGEQAIITGKPMAMIFEEAEYFFSQWDGKQWQQLNRKPFKPVRLKDDIKLSFYRKVTNSNRADNKSKGRSVIDNRVYFLPTGETESFYIELKNPARETYRIRVSLMGDLSVEQVKN